MDMWPRIVELLITPPGAVVVLLLLTFLVSLRRAWLGAGMLILSAVTLIALSLPLTAHWLMSGLQSSVKPPELVPMAAKGPQASLYVLKDSLKDPPAAIVVLGHGRTPAAPEYDFQDTVSAYGLERLRYAAFLQRKTGLPILVSGGAPGGESTAEADFMQKVLNEDFRAQVKWVERESRTTQENARYSQALLSSAKVRHVYLVTNAWHMRRAARAFESAGIKVTPAPTGFHTLERNAHAFHAYLPSASGMRMTALALHERFGLFWYGFKNDNLPAAAPQAQTPDAAPAPAPKKK
jgi:uncharacterized SAM-binding protein YcdF (DUF218 family)